MNKLAGFVTLESRLAPSIFPDEMMQIAIICLCACVGAGIFVTIRTQKWEGWSNKLVGSVLLLPLIIHAVPDPKYSKDYVKYRRAVKFSSPSAFRKSN